MQNQTKSPLTGLNPAQLEAASHIHGPVLVLAGPGTGKTHLLTARIAHILQSTDTQAENILCLTFTETGALEMQTRLRKTIGADVYRMTITTFHGFCQKILNNYPGYFRDEISEFEVLDEIERVQIFRKIIDQKSWKTIKPLNAPYLYESAIFRNMSDLKRQNQTADECLAQIPHWESEALQNPDICYKRDSKFGKKGEPKAQEVEKIKNRYAKLTEFCAVWKKFDAEKRKRKKYDFDDMIAWVVAEIKKNESLRFDLSEKYQFILADEYQDTNSSQNEIIWQIAEMSENPNIFAVGDDDQSIFRFQGASLENVLDFEKKFPSAKKIVLTQNYRSAQKVLDAAHTVIKNNTQRFQNIEKNLTAAGENQNFPSSITAQVAPSDIQEVFDIVTNIKFELANGTSPSEISVLVRSNKEIQTLSRTLPKFGITVSAVIAENIFDHAWVQGLINAMQCVATPSAKHLWTSFWHIPFLSPDLQPRNILEIMMQGRHFFTPPETEADTTEFNFWSDELQPLRDILIQAQKEFFHGSPLTFTQYLWHHLGGPQQITTTENRTEILANIQKFMEFLETNSHLTIPEVLEKIELHQELSVPVKPNFIELPNAIKIMTAHKSKGLEFDTIIIPGCTDGNWGGKKNIDKLPLPQLSLQAQDLLEDERRLFFVAITRAKKNIYLSYAETNQTGRQKSPSIFWEEIPPNLVHQKESQQNDAELLPVLLSQNTPLFTPEEKTLLQTKIQNFKWSASSLQAYLDCPRQFLWQNLFRVPIEPQKHMGFGIMVHTALEEFLKKSQYQQKVSTKAALRAELETAHKTQERNCRMAQVESQEVFEKAWEYLSLYFDQRLEFWKANLPNFKFEQWIEGAVNNIKIGGKIDLITINPQTKTAIFTDYKTGKPVNIKPGERLWRQLTFYDILAQNSEFGYNISETNLHFIRPDAKENCLIRPLQINESDRTAVIQELKTAHQNLKDLKFPKIENPDHDPEIDFWQNLKLRKV